MGLVLYYKRCKRNINYRRALESSIYASSTTTTTTRTPDSRVPYYLRTNSNITDHGKVELIFQVDRRGYCLTQIEMDMMFPPQKLKDINQKEATTLKTNYNNHEDNDNASIKSNSTYYSASKCSSHSGNSELQPLTGKKCETSSPTEQDIAQTNIKSTLNTDDDNHNTKALSNQSEQEDHGCCSLNQTDLELTQTKDSAYRYTLNSDSTCSICYEVFGKEGVKDSLLDNAQADQSTQVRLLSCNHCFHDKCISLWLLQSKATCPICNKDFLPDIPTDVLTLELGDQELATYRALKIHDMA